MKASSRLQSYFQKIDLDVNRLYDIASKCRKQGFDPTSQVDVKLAKNLAERVVGLISVVAPQIGDSGAVKRIVELEKKFGALDWRVGMQIALEIAQEKFAKFKNKVEAIEVGIRTGFAYVTLGVVSAPLEGFTHLELKQRHDDKREYFAMNFSGPVRNAGGTAAAVSVLIADYVRKHLGYAKYDPDEREMQRAHVELMDYHERITNLQYVPSKEETLFMVKNCPIEIAGDPTEKIEVSQYKDLARIKGNRIRGGFCLILSSCLPLKAPKLWKNLSKWINDMGMHDWAFLSEFLDVQKQAKSRGAVVKSDAPKSKEEENIYPVYTYIEDLVGGRPVIGHPIQPGGLRLRYGRSRVSGYSAQSIHPATMYVLDNFIAIGTQLKVERPGKAATFTSCDSLDGPIVELNDGSVVSIKTTAQAKELRNKVATILYLGDVLINYGDFFDRAHTLLPSGYCEEWWVQEVEKAAKEQLGNNWENQLATQLNASPTYIEELLQNPIKTAVSPQLAVKIAALLKVPLHPAYTLFWKLLSQDQLILFFQMFGMSRIKEDGECVLLFKEEFKQILNTLGLPHSVTAKEFIILNKDWTYILFNQFGFKEPTEFSVLQSKLKEYMTQNPQQTPFSFLQYCCPVILRDKAGVFIGARMGRPEKAKMRKIAGQPWGVAPQEQRFPDPNNPLLTQTKVVTEHHLKAQLREKNGVNANKDGCIRYDASEVPLTHFKPKEVRTPIEKLRSLGYTTDIHGKELSDENQILELLPQDIVIPCCTESPNEPSDEVLFRVTKYVDEELQTLYKVPSFYNLHTKNDLVGQLVFGLAPHTSAAIVGRIIGFTQSQGMYCHPMFHAAMRRDCDGDESCFFLLMDGFLNFSTKYLPQRRGSTMDAPLVLTSIINPMEVDDMVFNVDIGWKYPLEFYEACCEFKKPWDVSIPLFEKTLNTEKQFEGMGFTHDTSNFNEGVLCSAYKLLPSMQEKVDGQMGLAKKIAAVNTTDVAHIVITKHFLRDIMGNLRKFSTQQFRCVKCNTKYRRPPLNNRCETCNTYGKIIFTISKGSVVKYLELAKVLAHEYNVSDYTKEVLEVLQLRVDGVFGKEKEQQAGLNEFLA